MQFNRRYTNDLRLGYRLRSNSNTAEISSSKRQIDRRRCGRLVDGSKPTIDFVHDRYLASSVRKITRGYFAKVTSRLYLIHDIDYLSNQ